MIIKGVPNGGAPSNQPTRKKMMKNYKRRTIRMWIDLNDRLNAASDYTGASGNSIILTAIAKHLLDLERRAVEDNVRNAIEENPIGACEENRDG